MPPATMPPTGKHPCSRCGTPTEIRVGDRPICEDCYAALASCCAGEFEETSERLPTMKSAASTKPTH